VDTAGEKCGCAENSIPVKKADYSMYFSPAEDMVFTFVRNI
jgi:hypothetical protein